VKSSLHFLPIKLNQKEEKRKKKEKVSLLVSTIYFLMISARIVA